MDTERASFAMWRRGETDRDGICIALTECDPGRGGVYDPGSAGGFLSPYESSINQELTKKS